MICAPKQKPPAPADPMGTMSMMPHVDKLNVFMLMILSFILSNDNSNTTGSQAPCDQFDMCPCADCT